MRIWVASNAQFIKGVLFAHGKGICWRLPCSLLMVVVICYDSNCMFLCCPKTGDTQSLAIIVEYTTLAYIVYAQSLVKKNTIVRQGKQRRHLDILLVDSLNQQQSIFPLDGI